MNEAPEDDIQFKSAVEEDDIDPRAEIRKKKRRITIYEIIIIILAIVGIILFIVTEDTRTPMRYVDRYTIIHVILFLVIVVGVILIYKRTKKNENRDKYENNDSPGSSTET